ncbi:unnamed protein product [Adineta ricciae]|uniref:Mth938 domain-containing protein n=2 Tax=Adineta ricciae TaxID=249248 RepID=A0A813MPX8_ADIRI|nr:unnamed protein product [Adineta ricciae]
MTSTDIPKRSPPIEELKWGFMKVEGCPPGKDFKLFPGGAEKWDWRESNTSHVPGIQPQDVEYLLKKNAKYIVLSTGMENQLKIAKETEDFLREKGMQLNTDYFVKTTLDAHQCYNELAKDNKLVGALMHSTC